MKKIFWFGLILFGAILWAYTLDEPATSEIVTSDTKADFTIRCEDEPPVPASESISLNGYFNVLYTEENLDVLLENGRPKFVIAYDPW